MPFNDGSLNASSIMCVAVGDFLEQVISNGGSRRSLCKKSMLSTSPTLAARGLEEPRNFQESLTKSVGPVHFS